jgi:protein-tyrosine phosphatase
MQRINENLQITDIDAVRTESFDADRVVTVCQDPVEEHIPEGVEYDHFNLADDMYSSEIWGGSAEYPAFAEAAKAVLKAVRDGEDVLVHCHAGMNRSASVCIAVLGVTEDLPYREAYKLVSRVRPIIAPTDQMRLNSIQFIKTHGRR